MRALIMTGPSRGPDRTEVRDIPDPRPGPGQVTIDVDHAGINFVDVMVRRGDLGYTPAWPYVPGKEVTGTVRVVGTGVEGLTPEQRVAALTAGGGLAEIALASAELTVPVPSEVPSPVAAAAPLLLSSALLLLTDAARFIPGDAVLVHSASGGVGMAIAQLVPALGGGRLIGTVGHPGKTALALSAGYQAALPRTTSTGTDDKELIKAIRTAADGPVDIVLDALGTTMLDVDLEVTAPGGRIVLFGNAGGDAPAPLPPPSRLLRGNLGIIGFSISSLSVTAPHRVAAALRHVLDLLAAGRLDMPVSEVSSLGEVSAIHQQLAEGTTTGKFVVRVAG
ncbi:zinc-binding alcohol dehydrogenase family protein [Nonomuraea sp. NPDC050783]|uniref:quinone oxidoreductase family protein n=1 Tax=Nonomuraea sp. NPDC050783 TaxID=3154634 RepID=UPI003466F812